MRPEYARSLAGWLGMEVEVVLAAVKKNSGSSMKSTVDNVVTSNWRPDPNEPKLILEARGIKGAPADASLDEKLAGVGG